MERSCITLSCQNLELVVSARHVTSKHPPQKKKKKKLRVIAPTIELVIQNFALSFINHKCLTIVLHYKFRGAVVAQWIRPWTLNREVPSLNPLAATASSALGQGTLSSLPGPSERT